jgi:hypothetical protein
MTGGELGLDFILIPSKLSQDKFIVTDNRTKRKKWFLMNDHKAISLILLNR